MVLIHKIGERKYLILYCKSSLFLHGVWEYVGKTSFEGLKSISEASGYSSGTISQEASCCDIEVHAGTCSSAGSS